MSFRAMLDEKNGFGNVWPNFSKIEDYCEMMDTANTTVWLPLEDQLDFVRFINNEVKEF